MSAPDLSIVIVTHNSLPALRECLESLAAAAKGLDWELVVVDNNSDDSSRDVVKEIIPAATVEFNRSNEGFGRACNKGASLAAGKFLAFVNPDVTVDKGALKRLIAATEFNLRVGVAAGRLRYPDGSFQPTCRVFPTVTNLMLSRGSAISGMLPKASRYTMPDYETPTIVPAVAGTFILIRRSTFERVGGFDPRFFMYMEDTDLCYRLSQMHLKSIFVPSAGGIHRWGEGANAGRLRRTWLHHLSTWKYFLKHVPNGFSLIFLPFMLAANLALQALIAMVKAVFAGNRDVKPGSAE